METILVTGGAGAIGGKLSNKLLKLGYRVVVIDDLSSGTEASLEENIIFINGTICNDVDLNNAFSYKIDYVFHLAALFANQNSVEHPEKDLHTNGHGTLNVLRYSTKYKVKKLLYVSSSCVYTNQKKMDENAALSAFDTPYASTKYLGEMYCHIWSKHYKQDIIIVRLFNSYGPGEYFGKYRCVIPNFFHLAMNNKPLEITGTGEEIRDFNYVDDTLQGIMKAMFSPTKPCDVFNLASGKGTKIIDLALMINEITGNDNGIKFCPRRDWDSVSKRIGVINKAVKTLKYSPKTELRDGLMQTYGWFKNL